MKVIHVIDSLGFGGAERSLSFILPELERLGVKSSVVIFQESRKRVRIDADIPIHQFPVERNRDRKAWIRQVCTGADLVHTHLNFSTLQTRDALRQMPTPIVTTLHNIWYGSEHLHAFPWPGRWKVRWMRFMENVTLGPRTFLLAVSGAVAQVFAHYAKLGKNRITIISNAIDETFFTSPFGTRFDATCKSLLMVGRLALEKNQMLALEALARIPRPLRPVLHIYGQGPLQAELSSRADQLGVDLRLQQVQPDLTDVYSNHSIFLNFSKIEGQALVVLEAMARKTPCLLSDIPPHREVAGDAAMYVSPFDPVTAAQTLGRLLQETGLRDRLAAKGPERSVIARPKLVAQNLLAYYRAVLAGEIKPAK